jgi:hypothetical protein
LVPAGRRRKRPVLPATMVEQDPDSDFSLDLRHIGRVNDKDMPIEVAGMEMAKPGYADLRRRKYTVPLPDKEPDGPVDPLPTPG